MIRMCIKEMQPWRCNQGSTLRKGMHLLVSVNLDIIVKKTKENVREARKEMKALLASGMTFKEAILQHRELFNENMSMRDAAILELRQLEKEDTPENVKRYRDKMNKALEQMGIDPIGEKTRRKKNEESE